MLHRNFPRVERFGLGRRIEQLFLDVFELGCISSFSAVEQKIVTLSQVISKIDVLKFFLQLAWESKLIHTEPYAELLEKIEEIGRMFGGWRRGLKSKTLAD